MSFSEADFRATPTFIGKVKSSTEVFSLRQTSATQVAQNVSLFSPFRVWFFQRNRRISNKCVRLCACKIPDTNRLTEKVSLWKTRAVLMDAIQDTDL